MNTRHPDDAQLAAHRKPLKSASAPTHTHTSTLPTAGNGFFINTAITMVSVHASLWAYLLLALDKSTNPEVQKYLSAVQVLQLGTLSVGVYLFTLALEVGLLNSLFTIVRQVLQGKFETTETACGMSHYGRACIGCGNG
jgi:hypothetical protein